MAYWYSATVVDGIMRHLAGVWQNDFQSSCTSAKCHINRKAVPDSVQDDVVWYDADSISNSIINQEYKNIPQWFPQFGILLKSHILCQTSEIISGIKLHM